MCGICDCVCVCVCTSTCGKLIAVSVSCSPELLLSFSATRATSTPLLMTNTSSPLTLFYELFFIQHHLVQAVSQNGKI